MLLRRVLDSAEADDGADEAVSMTLEEAMEKLEMAGIEVSHGVALYCRWWATK